MRLVYALSRDAGSRPQLASLIWGPPFGGRGLWKRLNLNCVGATAQQRIDINVGDIIIEEDDIYGNGINIAARLAAIAGL